MKQVRFQISSDKDDADVL